MTDDRASRQPRRSSNETVHAGRIGFLSLRRYPDFFKLQAGEDDVIGVRIVGDYPGAPVCRLQLQSLGSQFAPCQPRTVPKCFSIVRVRLQS